MQTQIPTTTIQVSSGIYLDLENPKTEDINIDDISIGLSRECRFGGHTTEFYTVAQHCILASLLVPKEYALVALLHDASEAYIRDIATPLKKMMPEYKAIEAKLQATIYKAFNLPIAFEQRAQAAVKFADLQLLVTEREQLMPKDKIAWPGVDDEIESLDIQIIPLGPKEALEQYKKRYESIVNDTFDDTYKAQGVIYSVFSHLKSTMK